MERIRCQVLRALSQDETSVYRLIDRQDASLREFLSLLDQLAEEGLIYVQAGRAGLTEHGADLCRSQGLAEIGDLCCPRCQSTGLDLPPFLQRILKQYRAIVADRPEADKSFDQGFISAEGVIRRLGFVCERGDIYGSIFVVGDDDFFSVAAALTGLPERVVAVDVDDKVVDLINRAARDHSLRLEGRTYDVQEDLPASWRKGFDMFLTDPVETLPGLELFLSRGVSSLKEPGSAGYFGLTTLEASRAKWFDIQSMLQRMGFVVTDICRKFNVYPEEDKNFFSFQDDFPIVQRFGTRIDFDWYKSSLYRIEAVRDPEPLVQGRRRLDEKVYKDEESLATPF
jgi:hypothetical protein